jgi:hypothetical protein
MPFLASPLAQSVQHLINNRVAEAHEHITVNFSAERFRPARASIREVSSIFIIVKHKLVE